MDPASFTSLRLASGALVLALLLARRERPAAPAAPRPSAWLPAALLALYAVPFAFAYVTLTAGSGALLLFGAVQVTMLASTLARGERPRPRQWLGLTVALGGLVYLLLPGIAAPPLGGAMLMSAAGVAWGAYSLLGRGATDPLGATAANFLRAVPLALGASLLTWSSLHVEARGVLLATLSGAVASGLGYVVWYAALPGLSRLSASIVQLAVPVLAAAGGVLLLGEEVTLRLVVAGVAVLGGIALAVVGGAAAARPATAPSGGTGKPASNRE